MAIVKRERKPSILHFQTKLPGGMGGATFGPISITNLDATPDEMEHEFRHADQFSVPGWSIIKLVEALMPYYNKPLERDAFRHVQPSHEVLRRNKPVSPFDYSSGASDLIEAYLEKVLGK